MGTAGLAASVRFLLFAYAVFNSLRYSPSLPMFFNSA